MKLCFKMSKFVKKIFFQFDAGNIFTAIGGSLGLFLGFSFLDAITVALRFLFEKFQIGKWGRKHWDSLGSLTFSIITFSITTFGIMTLSIMTLSIAINRHDTHHDAVMIYAKRQLCWVSQTCPLCWVSLCWMLLGWVSRCHSRHMNDLFWWGIKVVFCWSPQKLKLKKARQILYVLCINLCTAWHVTFHILL